MKTNLFLQGSIHMFKASHNRKESGQGLVEYALILVLVAIVVIAVLMLLGPIIGNVFSSINSSLSGIGGGSSLADVPPDSWIHDDDNRTNEADCLANGSEHDVWGNGPSGVGCYHTP